MILVEILISSSLLILNYLNCTFNDNNYNINPVPNDYISELHDEAYNIWNEWDYYNFHLKCYYNYVWENDIYNIEIVAHYNENTNDEYYGITEIKNHTPFISIPKSGHAIINIYERENLLNI